MRLVWRFFGDPRPPDIRDWSGEADHGLPERFLSRSLDPPATPRSLDLKRPPPFFSCPSTAGREPLFLFL